MLLKKKTCKLMPKRQQTILTQEWFIQRGIYQTLINGYNGKGNNVDQNTTHVNFDVKF